MTYMLRTMMDSLLNASETIKKEDGMVLGHEVTFPPAEYDPEGQGVQEPEELS